MAIFALAVGDQENPLVVGKNVVGRSAVPVDGVSFISIHSPSASISRMQAIIEVCANGDVWVTDCESRNGTFIACGPGQGIRLEPKHYYQLRGGNRIVFGDVECRLVARTDDGVPCETSDFLSGALPYSASVVKSVFGTEGEHDHEERCKQPYLSTEMLKRRHSDDSKTGEQGPSPSAKRAKTEREPVSSSLKNDAVVTACLTGMNEKENSEASRLLRKHKAKQSASIEKCNVLVVGHPPTRTPKLIIAVGRGVPIVSVAFLEQPSLDLSAASKFTPSMAHDKHQYTAEVLNSTIKNNSKRPLLLDGKRYDVSKLSKKTKAVATEILEGCGAQVGGSKKQSFTASLVDGDLDLLYDGILRGGLDQRFL